MTPWAKHELTKLQSELKTRLPSANIETKISFEVKDATQYFFVRNPSNSQHQIRIEIPVARNIDFALDQVWIVTFMYGETVVKSITLSGRYNVCNMVTDNYNTPSNWANIRDPNEPDVVSDVDSD